MRVTMSALHWGCHWHEVLISDERQFIAQLNHQPTLYIGKEKTKHCALVWVAQHVVTVFQVGGKMPGYRCNWRRRGKHVLNTRCKHKPDCSAIQTWRVGIQYHATSVLTADTVYTDLTGPKIKPWKIIAAEQKRVSMLNWTRSKGKTLFPGASHVTDLEVSMVKTVVLRSPRRAIRVMLIPPFSPDESIFFLFSQ